MQQVSVLTNLSLANITNDSLDLNGQYFGKKWKHKVRNAQQTLKAQGKIVRAADGKWVLTDR